ncbi:hypothetical protein LGN24_07420 [Burkholderia seminalis]|uniref:hypothetical protein n=1 Tax=Burkholderia seminalis TaxID=488731 RepID=UPI001CF4CDC4|nr:hypothetical protein [Burkholderia seminalis]MCA8301312.1 hypothetical protein [Burkholderia seminalis]
MTHSPLVPVEGALARPRVAPLDHVPPFGRDWKFRGAPGARPSKNCLATLTTSCIDVDRPHRECRWQPTAAAGSLAAPVVAGRRVPRPSGNRRDRRAIYATCWSIGAFGIIGWLIAAHEPFTGFGPAYALQAADGARGHATFSTGTVRVAPVQPDTPAHTSPQHTAAAPTAKTAAPRSAAHRDTRRPAPLQPQASSGVQRAATPPPASPHRTAGSRTAAAPARTPGTAHVAARRPSGTEPPRAQTRDRLAPPPHATDTREAGATPDDPLTLIATANALRITQPERAMHAPAAGFDWTSRLSHRRLTDTPDAFAH